MTTASRRAPTRSSSRSATGTPSSASSALRPVRVGCSGWNYDDWRGRLYPEGLGKSRWLQRYAEEFDTVEVNSTFYRLASRDAVARWVEQTPDGFVFAAKASRYLTTDWTLVRLHHGHRGRRGNYSESEIEEWARRIAQWRRRADVLVYFNNDWEGFAVENARSLRRRLRRSPAG